MSTVQTKQTNLREKLAELLDFRKMRDRLSGLGLYIGKDRTGTDENLLVRGGANVDDLQIGEIAALVGETAVDVFVYDTSRDSDGGKWRERTQHTSWYNEELNTATRGGRREFPAVAVIVAEVGKVTIYDGDDPDLSMWMVFDVNNDVWLKHTTGNTVKSVEMLNAKLVTAGFRLSVVDFIDDSGYVSESSYCYEHNNISRRNIDGVGAATGNIFIVNNQANDVAMTILPNAPIDDDTGLPVPTIAVATDGGVSVIKHDGTVVSKATTAAAVNQVKWMGPSRLVASTPLYYSVFDNPFVEESAEFLGYISDNVYNADPSKNYIYQVPNIITYLNDDSKLLAIDNRTIIASTSNGLDIHEMGEGAAANNNHGVAAYITSKYNTGWMLGDIKLATLSDSVMESVGVNEGTELVVDSNGNWVGDFDQSSDLNGWGFIGSGTSTITANGMVRITNAPDAQTNPYFRSPVVNVEPGRTYKFSFYYLGDGANQIRAYIHSTNGYGNDQAYSPFYGQGFHSLIFTATASSVWIKLAAYDTSFEQEHTYDNISIKEYNGELITNGDFSSGTATSAYGWTVGSSTSLNASSREAVISGTHPGGAYIYQQLGQLTAGKEYTVSFDLKDKTGTANARVYIGTASNGISVSELKNHSFTFLYEEGDRTFYLQAPGNATATFDNVSVRLAEADRSVNNNGLQIMGEINKTPVAPGADLVAYSGFSVNNYLVQPYNEDLDFGTGDFSIAFWFNFSAGVEDQKWDDLFSLGDLGYQGTSNASSFIHAQLNTVSDYLDLYIGGFNTTDKIASISNLSRDTWSHVVLTRKNGIATAFINGSQYASKSNNLSIGGAGLEQYNLRIGYTGDNYGVPGVGFPANYSKIALFRVSKTAPTPDQIAKIYRDEKALFQDGAQATLYGTSDAVTALAYDEKTELLHVGTSSGRSDFSGLRRINNTTIPVTTSISASNNLIAEQ